jgi:hypothetical protein
MHSSRWDLIVTTSTNKNPVEPVGLPVRKMSMTHNNITQDMYQQADASREGATGVPGERT